MCVCQQFGKSGVPYPSGKCIICGEKVDTELPIIYGPDANDYQNWRDVLRPLAETDRVRVTRILVYEGPKSWVHDTLMRAACQSTGPAEFTRMTEFRTDAKLICTEEKIETL